MFFPRTIHDPKDPVIAEYYVTGRIPEGRRDNEFWHGLFPFAENSKHRSPNLIQQAKRSGNQDLPQK